MKVIQPNKVSGVTASDENVFYIDQNLLDDHPKKVWRALGGQSSVTVSVRGGADAVGIANIGAVSVALTVKGTNGTDILDARTSYDLKGIDTYFEFITDDYTTPNSYWIEYEYQADEHLLVLDFEEAEGEIVEAGTIQVGISRTFYDPNFDLQEGLKDYSVIKELNNGSWYIRKRDIIRTFSGSVDLERDSDFYVFMRAVMQEEGASPLFWYVAEYDSTNWAVFARADMPKASHNHRHMSNINFSLTEVI